MYIMYTIYIATSVVYSILTCNIRGFGSRPPGVSQRTPPTPPTPPAAGLDPSSFGAKAFRAGGATDWRDTLGEEGKYIIRKRGRWWSDVDDIYQRPILDAQLAASARVGDARGEGMEEVIPGFVQQRV